MSLSLARLTLGVPTLLVLLQTTSSDNHFFVSGHQKSYSLDPRNFLFPSSRKKQESFASDRLGTIRFLHKPRSYDSYFQDWMKEVKEEDRLTSRSTCRKFFSKVFCWRSRHNINHVWKPPASWKRILFEDELSATPTPEGNASDSEEMQLIVDAVMPGSDSHPTKTDWAPDYSLPRELQTKPVVCVKERKRRKKKKKVWWLAGAMENLDGPLENFLSVDDTKPGCESWRLLDMLVQDPAGFQLFHDVLRTDDNLVQGSAFYSDQQEFFQTVYTTKMEGGDDESLNSNRSVKSQSQVNAPNLGLFPFKQFSILDGKSIALMEARDNFQIADFSGMNTASFNVKKRSAGESDDIDNASESEGSVMNALQMKFNAERRTLRLKNQPHHSNFQLKLHQTKSAMPETGSSRLAKAHSNQDLLKMNPTRVLKMQKSEAMVPASMSASDLQKTLNLHYEHARNEELHGSLKEKKLKPLKRYQYYEIRLQWNDVVGAIKETPGLESEGQEHPESSLQKSWTGYVVLSVDRGVAVDKTEPSQPIAVVCRNEEKSDGVGEIGEGAGNQMKQNEMAEVLEEASEKEADGIHEGEGDDIHGGEGQLHLGDSDESF